MFDHQIDPVAEFAFDLYDKSIERKILFNLAAQISKRFAKLRLFILKACDS